MSTPVRVSRSERPGEDLPSRRLQEPSTTLSTGVSITGNVCSEASLEETRAQESSALQLEQVCTVEEAKFPDLQFSRGYALDNNK